MTPTSTLGGVLIGLLDGGIIALLVFVGVVLSGKWHRTPATVRPVADDAPDRTRRIGELPGHD